MDKRQVHVRFSEEAEKVIREIQEEQNLNSLNKTLEFIVLDYDRNRNIADTVSKKVTENLDKILTRIRLGTRTADINSQIIVEMLNAIAMQFDVKPMTTEYGNSTVYEVSSDYVKNKIAKYKQNTDQKKHK